MQKKLLKLILTALLLLLNQVIVFASEEAIKPSNSHSLSKLVKNSVLYLPISSPEVLAIPIVESTEKFVDLEEINNPRIRPIWEIDKKRAKPYEGCSKVRNGVYICLLKMLEFLPKEIGIAYEEGYRPILQQKIYFEQKFLSLIKTGKLDLETAYNEASKYVSPFIKNIPPHCAGAAIDMTLFIKNKKEINLLDLGEFNISTTSPNTFDFNITTKQMKNRMLLLSAATKAGLVNYGYEWWHFSYGDRAWAYVKKTNYAKYGLSEEDKNKVTIKSKEEYFNSLDLEAVKKELEIENKKSES